MMVSGETRGNIEWLLEESPELFSKLAEMSSFYVCRPDERMKWRDEFGDIVGRYNMVAKAAGMPAVPPDELSLFAQEICKYFWNKHTR